MDMDYESFYKNMNLYDAIERLGKKYIEFLLKNWQQEISLAIRNSWLAMDSYIHPALCALMQAGEMAVRERAGF